MSERETYRGYTLVTRGGSRITMIFWQGDYVASVASDEAKRTVDEYLNAP